VELQQRDQDLLRLKHSLEQAKTEMVMLQEERDSLRSQLSQASTPKAEEKTHDQIDLLQQKVMEMRSQHLSELEELKAVFELQAAEKEYQLN